jgi:hypothetical protein
MKRIVLVLFLLPLFSIAQTVTVFSDDFGTGCSADFPVTSYSPASGSWTVTETGTNVLTANSWYVSAMENGNEPGQCGSGCGNDRTLHIGSDQSILGDIGAAYFEGLDGFCDFFGCGTTDKRVDSPTLDCTGLTAINLQFDYIEGGNAQDNATLWYYDGATWSQLANMAKTVGACSPQGTWTEFTIALPVSAENNPNVKIGIRWVNNDNGVASDPSIAVDDVIVTGQMNTVDVTPPVISCATTLIYTCEDLPDFTSQISATDDLDASPQITQSPAPGSAFSGGPLTIEFTATDNAGNSSTCSVDATFEDLISPTIICPEDITIVVTQNELPVQIPFGEIGAPEAEDNCSIPSISNDYPSDIFPEGTTLITWTATDGEGNTATCTQAVNVIVDEAPVITCPGEISDMAVPPVCTPSWATGCADDMVDRVTITAPNGEVIMDTGNTGCSGTPTSWSVSPTTTTLVQGSTYNLRVYAVVNFTQFFGVWYDINNDGSFDGPGEFLGGNMMAAAEVSFVLQVPNDLYLIVQRRLRVISDFSAPLLEGDYCNLSNWGEGEDFLLTINSASLGAVCNQLPYYLNDIVVSDDFDDAPALVQSPPAGSFISSDTEVTVTATDNAGNTSTCSFMVYYEDITPPVIECPADIVAFTADGFCTTGLDQSQLGNPFVLDNCSIEQVENTWTSLTQYPMGNSVIEWTAYDTFGNSSTCDQQVTVLDIENPEVICAPLIEVSILEGETSALVEVPEPLVSDNCTVTSITNSFNENGSDASDVYPLGTTMVTYTVLDQSNNFTTCNSFVEVSVQEIICCLGDFNCDGYISVLDLIILINEFGCLSGCATSIDGNTTVTVTDVQVFTGLYGTICP